MPGLQSIPLEIAVTHVCNAYCEYCNKAIGLMRIADSTVTPAQIDKAGQLLQEQGIEITRVTLAGGEPTIHPDLPGLVDACMRLPGVSKGLEPNRIFTNGILRREGYRATYKLPDNWRWIETKLRNTNDPLSGKKFHVPCFIDPTDYDMEGRYEGCYMPNLCGHGLESHGFTMCSVAGVLGRLLRINPYSTTRHVRQESPDGICRHCIYGLPKAKRKRLERAALAGKIEPISRSYVEAIKQHRQSPMDIGDRL